MTKTKELSYECEIFKTKVWMVPDITLWVTDVIIPFSMGSTPPSDDPLGIIEWTELGKTKSTNAFVFCHNNILDFRMQEMKGKYTYKLGT